MVRRDSYILMALVLSICVAAGCAMTAYAIADTNATIEVSDKMSHGEGDSPDGVSIGTDVYLIVDSDTASYVTIRIRDEQGRLIEDALIYLNGKLYGSSDENGELVVYLLRNVDYQYRITKYGYTSASGSFRPTDATKIVTVVLSKMYQLNIMIVDGNLPCPGIGIIINGKTVWTKEKGMAEFTLPRGIYNAVIRLLDGKTMDIKIHLNQNRTIVIDIGRTSGSLGIDHTEPTGGQFILFDREYTPKDYLLTLFPYTAEEKALWDGTETFEGLKFLHTLHIIAAPLEENDEPVMDEKGNAIYEHINLRLDGTLMQHFVGAGLPYLRLDNEYCTFSMFLPELYSENIAKLMVLMYKDGADAIKGGVEAIDFDSLPDVTTWLDSNTPMLTKSMFSNCLLEVRMTPIQEDVLALSAGLLTEEEASEVLLVSGSLADYQERIRLDEGHLEETESMELRLLDMASRASRVQIYLTINGTDVNITSLLKTMTVGISAEELLEGFATQLLTEGVAVEEMEAKALERMLSMVGSQAIETITAHGAQEYIQGAYTHRLGMELVKSVPDKHLREVNDRWMLQYDVHILLDDLVIAKEFFFVPRANVTNLNETDLYHDLPIVWYTQSETAISGLHLLTWE